MEQLDVFRDYIPPTDIKGKTFDASVDYVRLNAQQTRVWNVIQHGSWMALFEIAAVTNDPEASVSARLRDIRRWLKPQGGDVLRRRRKDAGLYEYSVRRPGEVKHD